jgi:hypothetical protein
MHFTLPLFDLPCFLLVKYRPVSLANDLGSFLPHGGQKQFVNLDKFSVFILKPGSERQRFYQRL